ncbi:hypothetical protein DESUT3_35590 [Desulfuromonas versatilis]|uniref:C4-type zinc ribbon domain-containing protein n=1 Tax=Desulfuromonas versatilis TaxID=2802975 RepID=A0ABM8I0G6_9BACT|nr:C4-type zinc ribbon domain-containing protein [Desulfuromonas versatilis]BCR06490.1 hypothetical protein DESUT3_35590 [Desulfuromonas versatilis]
MQEKLQLLKQLQGLDQELKAIREKRRVLEDEQAALDADVQRIQTMVDSLVAEVDGLQADRRELAQALGLEQENVEKAEGRLPGIKTQKEYVAVLKEIDTAKKLNKDLQDRIREKDGEIEALTRDKEEKQTELTSLSEQVGGRRSEISAALGDFDGALADKGELRDQLLKQLSAQLRSRYQLLVDRRGGIAVVEARNGACQGCNMHLPPQLFNSLFKADDLQTCPHCNRLLYVEQGQ